jgi:endonuclease YncB( thermonuclease family)
MHDFKRFPELAGEDLDLYYWDSPHRQIFENFHAKVVDVHDGDTIKVLWSERDFAFPIRFNNTAAPELNEKGGIESRNWLRNQLLGKEVEVIIDLNNRVEKWGRLLGQINVGGFDIGEISALEGHSVPWAQRKDGVIEDII